MPPYPPTVGLAIAAETAASEAAIQAEKMLAIQATGAARAFAELAAVQRAWAAWIRVQITSR
jgi:hypothetical protein